MSEIEYNAQAVIEHLTAQRHRVTVERDRLIDDVISIKAQRDELLAALKEARADVARIESGKFCDLRETLREIDAAMDKAHAAPSSPDL